ERERRCSMAPLRRRHPQTAPTTRPGLVSTEPTTLTRAWRREMHGCYMGDWLRLEAFLNVLWSRSEPSESTSRFARDRNFEERCREIVGSSRDCARSTSDLYRLDVRRAGCPSGASGQVIANSTLMKITIDCAPPERVARGGGLAGAVVRRLVRRGSARA